MKMHFSIKILLFFCIVPIGCDKNPKRVEENFTEDDALIEIGEDVEILYSDSAVVRVRVTAPILHNINDRDAPRQEFNNGIRVDFFDNNFGIKSTLTSKFAVRLNEKGKVIARDSVVLTTTNQEILETEELTWDEKKETINTDKFVKITKPGEVIYGYGLEASQDFSYWKILVPKGQIKAGNLDDGI